MRNIEISQRDVLAMHGSGMSRKQVAAHYGVTSEEMYNVYQQFGIYKTRTESASAEYRIIPVFDFVNTSVVNNNLQVNDEELPATPYSESELESSNYGSFNDSVVEEHADANQY